MSLTKKQCNCLHDEKDVQHFYSEGFFDFFYCHDCELSKSKEHYCFRIPYESEEKVLELNSNARFVND